MLEVQDSLKSEYSSLGCDQDSSHVEYRQSSEKSILIISENNEQFIGMK